MSTNIYVLRLVGGKYYIGKSNNVVERCDQHLKGKGCAWTQKYKPVGVEKVIENVSPFEEDKITKEYMSKYGIDRVRGGAYVEVHLGKDQQEGLQRELWAAKDVCTQCGRAGHYVRDCYAKTDVLGNELVYEDSEDDDEYEDEYDDDDDDSFYDDDE